MRAILVSETGGPAVLVPATVPRPEPGPGDVLVRVTTAGVNFIDIYYRTGAYPVPLPFVPGQEAAGVVEQVGQQADGIRQGDRVAWASVRGAYAEYAVVPRDAVVLVSGDVTDDQAAAIMLQGLAAQYLTHSAYAVRGGQVVLVHSAAGGLGRLVTRLAAHLGATVIGTVSTAAKVPAAVEAGAHHVIVRSEADVALEVRRLTAGQGADAVYDSIGADTFESSLSSLAVRGTLLLCGTSSGQVPPFSLERLRAGSFSVTRPSLAHYTRGRAELAARAAEVFALVGAGVLTPMITAALPVESAADAHRALESGTTTGKLLLRVNTQAAGA